jgi:hypothetical protein
MENFKKVLLVTFLFHTIWLLTMISIKTNEIFYLISQVGGLLFVIYYLTSVVIVSLISLLFIKILK